MQEFFSNLDVFGWCMIVICVILFISYIINGVMEIKQINKMTDEELRQYEKRQREIELQERRNFSRVINTPAILLYGLFNIANNITRAATNLVENEKTFYTCPNCNYKRLERHMDVCPNCRIKIKFK